jgi:hypothetical protein
MDPTPQLAALVSRVVGLRATLEEIPAGEPDTDNVGRARSLALTKLDECLLWARHAMTGEAPLQSAEDGPGAGGPGTPPWGRRAADNVGDAGPPQSP